MSTMQEEGSEEILNQDSSVCVGDGITCVECGKVFTHPFYFSTHISSHTSEKGFVVIGQCALCGLVFSDADVFAAHLNSSQLKLEKQVAPPQEESVAVKGDSSIKGKVASRVASAVKKKSTEIKLEINDQEDIKVENHSPQSSEVKAGGKNVTDSTDEARGKRKRKAPQRYEIDSGPQLATSRVAADPEVEAYLLSLKQMGLTVDPEAFSSGSKRRRKTSEGSGGKGRGRKEFLLVEDLGSDVLFQQKQSPKYEYLDADDSFDEEPEILPESGKMTRGQRLQQRHERLSQGVGSSADKKPDIVKLEVTSNADNNEPRKETSPVVDVATQDKETVLRPKPNATVTQPKSNTTVTQPKPNATVTQPKSNATATGVKRVQPTAAPSQVIKKDKPTVAAPYFADRVPQLSYPRGRGRGALAQQNIGKMNAVRANHAPQFAGRNNQYRAFSMPNTSNSNIYQPRSAVANNSGPRPLRFPQGQVRERKDPNLMLQNMQQSNSLEDLKRNSRDNVEMMLQSVGMIAVTSSAMGQGKIFGSEKANLYPPVKKMEAANIRQSSHPYIGFGNKPFSSQKNLPSQQSGSFRGQARFGSGPRGRLPAHPQPYRSNFAVQLSHGQGFGVGSQRGRGQQFSSSSLRGSVRGRGSNPTARGGFVSSNNMMRGSGRGRGLNSPARGGLASANSTMRGSVRGRGSNPPARGNVSATNSASPMAPSRGRGGTGSVSKQTKPVQAAGDVIVIVDDDDVQEISAGPSGVLPAGSSSPAVSSKSPRSSTARGSKVQVAILDVDLDSLNSDIKVIEDTTKELSSPTGIANLPDNASIEQPPHDDVDDNDDEVEGKHEREEKSNDSLKVKSKPLQMDADIQRTSGNDKIDDVDTLPGEIYGWKVCLAEDSDSNDDTPSPQLTTSKASVSKDPHLSPAGSPGPSSSPQNSEQTLEDLTRKTSPHQLDSDVSQKVEHSNSQPLQKVEQSDSQPQEDAECQSVSATAELKIELVDSNPQNGAEHNAASEIMCHEKEEICDDDIQSVVVSDQEFVPYGSNENQTEEVKSESPGGDASSLMEDVSQAGFEDILEELKHENPSLSGSHTEDRTVDYIEDAEQSVQTALTADTTTTPTLSANDSTTEDRPFIPDSNSDSSVALLPEDDVVSDKETGYNEAGAGSAVCETAIEENCLTNIDFETGPAIILPDSGILVADVVPALSCSHTSNGSSSDQAEEDSITLPLDSDLSLVNGSSHSYVSNSKLDSEPDVGSTSLPAGSSNAVSPENSVDSAHNTFSSHPPVSHSCPVAAADCLRDDSNLLDIFTEIEKTCKEMEQTLDTEADKKSLVLTEKVDVSRPVSDLSEELVVVKEELDFNGVVKVEDRSNGVAFSESRSDVGVKESRSGDCRYSDMIYEKEVIDNGNVPSIDEEHNNSQLVEKDATGDDCGDDCGM